MSRDRVAIAHSARHSAVAASCAIWLSNVEECLASGFVYRALNVCLPKSVILVSFNRSIEQLDLLSSPIRKLLKKKKQKKRFLKYKTVENVYAICDLADRFTISLRGPIHNCPRLGVC